MTTGTTLYNLDMLNDATQGNREFFREMIRLFISQTTNDVAMIEQGFANGDLQLVGSLAHRIKPLFDQMDIKPFKQKIRELERLGKEHGDINRIAELVVELNMIITSVNQQLQQNELN
jgi:hypothetical protein